MLGKLVLVLLLLIATASAESAIMNNYSIEFNITEPHQTLIEEYSINVKTFDGFVTIFPYQRTTSLAEFVAASDIPDGKMYMHNDGYVFVAEYENYFVIDTMPIMDFMDFLKTLKVEKITQ